MTSLDPRAALVLDTHELGRRAGAMLERTISVEAEEDFGTEVIAVPAGARLELAVRLESVIEGVLVTGDVTATASGECARCLSGLTAPVHVDFQELFEYPDADNAAEDSLLIEDDLINLEPVVRDVIVLSLPLAPLCSEDCLGLCPECGFELNTDPHHHHDIVDARWKALEGLLERGDSQEG